MSANLGAIGTLCLEPAASGITREFSSIQSLQDAPESTVDAPALMAMKYVQPSAIAKTLTIQGATTTAAIKLDGDAALQHQRIFCRPSQIQTDLQFVTNFWCTHVQMVAYLPHMYFFVIPMSIGDCLTGMGNLKQAEEQYRSILPYPFINKQYEIIKLWTRLAQVYLDMGDSAYRNAKDSINALGPASTFYANIVLVNKTLNPNSPLYQDAKFAAIKTRVMNFLGGCGSCGI